MHACNYNVCIGLTTDCSVEDLVIVYSIVQGCFNLLYLIVYASSVCASAKDKESTLSTCLSCFNLILIVFFIAWTIAASAWVLRSLDDWIDEYYLQCNNELYNSTLIFLALHYVVILLLFCRCSCMVYIHQQINDK